MAHRLTRGARTVGTVLALAVTFAFVQGCDRQEPSTGDEAIDVTVRFRDDAPSVAMLAFFEGFNAGSFGMDGSASRFNLNTGERKMTLEFRRADAVDHFTFVAERSEIVESVEPPGTL